MDCEHDEIAKHITAIMGYLESNLAEENYMNYAMNVICGCVGYICGNCDRKGHAFERVRQHIDEYEEIYNRTTINEVDKSGREET